MRSLERKLTRHCSLPSVASKPAGGTPTAWSAALLLAILSVHGACSGRSDASTADGRTPLAVERPLSVEMGPFSEHHLLTGELVAETADYLLTPNTNQWPVTIRWLADDGQEVAAGETVAEFDNSQLVSNLEQLTAQWTEAKNELSLERSRVAESLAQAKYDLEERRGAHEKAQLAADVPAELSSRQDFEQRRLELAKAELALEQAQQDLAARSLAGDKSLAVKTEIADKARRAVERLQLDLDKLRLTAPRDGLVLVATDSDGRVYQTGDNAIPGAVVASMPDLSSLMVEARLFDVDDGKVEVDQRVRVHLDAFPEETLGGTIREITDFAEQESADSTRRAFKVRIDVEGIDADRMRPGMSVRVRLDLEPIEVPLIPRSAILWTADGSPEATLADGRSVPIRLGPCNASRCVLEEGPAVGTALAVAGGLG